MPNIVLTYKYYTVNKKLKPFPIFVKIGKGVRSIISNIVFSLFSKFNEETYSKFAIYLTRGALDCKLIERVLSIAPPIENSMQS